MFERLRNRFLRDEPVLRTETTEPLPAPAPCDAGARREHGMPRVLVTGRGGRAGSWRMRGEQLGTALGATVCAMANDLHDHDLAVVVKRTPRPVVRALRGRRWVWDIVDAYPQPEAYGWTRDRAIRWLRSRLLRLRPAAVLWPTRRMREDCDTGLPGLVLPHHHRIGIARNPVRRDVRRVGYEGEPAYLGGWAAVVAAQCARRGWEFVVNPPRLADVDIALALRDGGGYVCRHWKSAVKLANAHASGTPVVAVPESGYLETATGAERWARDEAELARAFDALQCWDTRARISDAFVRHAYPVERAARDLRSFIDAL